MADNKVTVDFDVVGNAAKKIDDIAASVDKLGASLDSKLSRGAQAFNIFAGNLAAGLAEKALSSITDAASKLFDTFIVDGVKAAQEQEDAINQLNRALAGAGKYTAAASKSFQDFADEMQRTTRFSDDAVISAGALLGSIARLDSDGLKRGTQAAANMASALKIDLDTAIRLVAKGAEGNVESFKRYGIEVQKGSNNAQSFANVLDALNSRFSGAAQSDAQTYGGAVKILGNTFNDLQEAVGNVIVQNPALTGVLSAAAGVFRDLSGWIKENNLVIQEWVAKGVQVAVASLRALIEIANAVTFGKFAEQLIIADNVMRGFGQASEEGLAKLSMGITNAAPAIKNNTQKITELDDATKKLIDTGNKLIEQYNQQGVAASVKSENEIAAINAATEAKLAAAGNDAVLKQQIEDQASIARETSRQDANAAEIADLQAQNALLAQERSVDAQAQIDSNNLLIESKIAKESDYDKRKREFATKQAAFEKQQNTEKLNAAAGIFGGITTLAQAAGKDGFEIAKQASAAEAVIKGILAVQQALASAPPPFNFVLAGIVGAVAAVNVAKIESASPPSFAGGIDEVPAGFGNDKFPAFLQTGERVVPASTNRDLKGFLSDQGGMIDELRGIRSAVASLQWQVNVMIDDNSIGASVRRSIESGRVVFA